MMEFILILITIIMVYGIIKDQLESYRRFKIELKAAQSKISKLESLSFEDCRAVINHVINFICINEDVTRGYFKKTQEAFSLDMDKIIVDIALKARMAISSEIVDRISNFITTDGEDNFLDKYILDTTRIILLDEISYRRKSLSEFEPIVSMKRNPINHTITTGHNK